MAAGILIGLFINVLALVPPYLAKLFLDNVYPTSDLELLDALVLGLMTVSATAAMAGALQSYCTDVVSARLANATTLLFFNQLQHMPTRFFDEHAVGEIQSRFNDVETALSTMSSVIRTLFGTGIFLLIIPPLLLVLNWRLAIVALATAPIIGLVTMWTSSIVRRHWARSAEMKGELGGFRTEVLSQIRTFKALAAERFAYEGARERTEAALRDGLRASGVTAAMTLVNGLTRAAGTVVFSWYGWTLVVEGRLSIGAFVAFVSYVSFLSMPIEQITALFTRFQQATVSLARMFEYMDAPVEQDPNLVRRPPVPRRPACGELRIVDLDFGYTPERRALDGISVTLRPGTITALVGPSGSGKSSLLRLLCRLTTPDHGTILFDGVPMSALPLAAVRAEITAVWQEVALLRGSLWYNLTIGLDDPSPEVVGEVIRACQLEEVLRDLPDGYDTEVGEWGSTLSGGQRQRFAIARALLRDTPVLLLDEATSQLDVKTEEQILRAVFAYTREKTVLFVTHRVATAALADQVCVLEEGRLVGIGTHAELTETCEPYRSLLHVAGADQRSLRMVVADR